MRMYKCNAGGRRVNVWWNGLESVSTSDSAAWCKCTMKNLLLFLFFIFFLPATTYSPFEMESSSFHRHVASDSSEISDIWICYGDHICVFHNMCTCTKQIQATVLVSHDIYCVTHMQMPKPHGHSGETVLANTQIPHIKHREKQEMDIIPQIILKLILKLMAMCRNITVTTWKHETFEKFPSKSSVNLNQI